MNVTRSNNPVNEDGGAIDRKTVGLALMGVGVGSASVWNLSSTVHTLIAAPVASIATLGTATVASGSGAYLWMKKDQEDYLAAEA